MLPLEKKQKKTYWFVGLETEREREGVREEM